MSDQGDIKAQLERLVAARTDKCGLELVEVEPVRAHGGWRIQVTVDRPGGVTVGECARLSRDISSAIEDAPDLAMDVELEVGSPGLTRPLKKPGDYETFKGRPAVLKLSSALEGQRRLCGLLAGYDEDNDMIRLEERDSGKLVLVPRSLVARGRLDFEFPRAGSKERRGPERERERP